MRDAGLGIGFEPQRFAMQDRSIDKVAGSFEGNADAAVIGREIGCDEHGADGAHGIEAEGGQQTLQRTRAGPAGAAGAVSQPGREVIFCRCPWERSGVARADVDQLAEVVERDVGTPPRVKRGEARERRLGRAIKAEATQDALGQLWWQRSIGDHGGNDRQGVEWRQAKIRRSDFRWLMAYEMLTFG